MAWTLSPGQVALQIAEKLRDIATRQGRVPFKTGWLRKGHRVEPVGTDGARLTADTPYARAVHDGRPALTIRPKKGRALVWPGAAHPVAQVRQPARAARPWITDSVADLNREGLAWLTPAIGDEAVRELEKNLANANLITRRGS